MNTPTYTSMADALHRASHIAHHRTSTRHWEASIYFDQPTERRVYTFRILDGRHTVEQNTYAGRRPNGAYARLIASTGAHDIRRAGAACFWSCVESATQATA